MVDHAARIISWPLVTKPLPHLPSSRRDIKKVSSKGIKKAHALRLACANAARAAVKVAHGGGTFRHQAAYKNHIKLDIFLHFFSLM